MRERDRAALFLCPYGGLPFPTSGSPSAKKMLCIFRTVGSPQGVRGTYSKAPYGYLRYSASGDLSESVVENKVFSSREQMGASYFPYGEHTAKMTRTGAFAALKENQRFSEPDWFFTIPVRAQQKRTPFKVCVLLVTLNQPKSNLLQK